MGDTYEAPLLFDVVETAQEELANIPAVFDLAEDRLGELLAETIATSVTAKFELSAHRLNEWGGWLPLTASRCQGVKAVRRSRA